MKVHSASRHLRPNCQQLGKKYKIDVLPCSRLLCKSLTKNVDEWTFVDAAVCQQREDCVKSTVVKYTFTLILISASPSLIKGNILYFYATLLICFFFFFFVDESWINKTCSFWSCPKNPAGDSSWAPWNLCLCPIFSDALICRPRNSRPLNGCLSLVYTRFKRSGERQKSHRDREHLPLCLRVYLLF